MCCSYEVRQSIESFPGNGSLISHGMHFFFSNVQIHEYVCGQRQRKIHIYNNGLVELTHFGNHPITTAEFINFFVLAPVAE